MTATSSRDTTRLLDGQKAIREHYLSDGDALRMLRSRSPLIDQLLAELWAQHGMPSDSALAAVGVTVAANFPGLGYRSLILLPGPPDRDP